MEIQNSKDRASVGRTVSRRDFLKLSGASFAGAVLLGSTGCLGASEPSEESRLIVCNPYPTDSLDPHGANAAALGTQVPARQVFDTLVLNREGEIIPSVATGWERTDDTTWVFTLRDDVTFHDGTTLTAADVKATIERIQELEGPLAALWEPVTEARAESETTLILTTGQPLGNTLLYSFTLLFIGPADRMSEEDFFNQPVGSGPFQVESFAPGESLALSAYPDYWDGPPQLQNLQFNVIPEISARMTALQTGEIDLTWDVPADQLSQIEGNEEIVVDTAPSYNSYVIWFNSGREPFNDARVRRAMWHAVDTEQIVADLFTDTGEQALAPVARAVFGWSEQEPHSYDPQLARRLLAEAGYQDGFSATAQWDDAQDRQLAQAMISYWQEVGIRIDGQEKEPAVWLEDLVALNWDINFQAQGSATGDPDYLIGRLYTCEAERTGYCNPELDEVLAQAKASADEEERAELYAQANEIIWSDAVGIYPVDLLAVYASRQRVEGLQLDPGRVPSFYGVTVDGSA